VQSNRWRTHSRDQNNGEYNGHLRLPPPACASQPLAHALHSTNSPLVLNAKGSLSWSAIISSVAQLLIG
jgi:hypothetical protein